MDETSNSASATASVRFFLSVLANRLGANRSAYDYLTLRAQLESANLLQAVCNVGTDGSESSSPQSHRYRTVDFTHVIKKLVDEDYF